MINFIFMPGEPKLGEFGQNWINGLTLGFRWNNMDNVAENSIKFYYRKN